MMRNQTLVSLVETEGTKEDIRGRDGIRMRRGLCILNIPEGSLVSPKKNASGGETVIVVVMEETG